MNGAAPEATSDTGEVWCPRLEPHPQVLTLVVAGELPAEEMAELARGVLRGAGAQVSRPRWLGPAACDLELGEIEALEAEHAVRRALGGAPFDLAVQSADGRRKRLLLADLESTVIRQEMLDELAARHGVGAEVAAATESAMRGEIDFAAALRDRVALLVGLPESELVAALENAEVDPGAATLVATMRADGAYTALVSGGFSCFARPIARLLEFDTWRANRLEIVDDALTGRVVEPILDGEAKGALLAELCAEHGLSEDEVAAVGDGANDLVMLAAAGLGVAYHGKPAVAATARYRVDHGDLRTLLYFQGYHDDEMRSV